MIETRRKPILVPLALLAVGLAFGLAHRLHAGDEFQAWTATKAADNESPVFNLLTWPRPESGDGEPVIQRFNVYRKIDPQAPYPQFPLNFTPLAVLKNCNDIKQIIPEGSLEWDLIKKALSGNKLFIGQLKPLQFVLENKNKGPQILQAPIPIATPSTACDIWKLETDSGEFQRLQLLARKKWKVAVVLGQGFQDLQVVQDNTYYYQITGLDDEDNEHILDTDIVIQAGNPVPVPPPQGLEAIPGDSRVLVHWDEVPEAMGFDVYRSTTANGTYKLINEASLTAKLTLDFNDQPIAEDESAVDGFVDFQRWTPSGSPKSHKVEGAFISGPKDGVTYYYKVAGTDLLDQPGELSDEVEATPQDTTPPAVPKEVTVVPDDENDRIEIRWAKVTHDTDGHREQETKGYRVWRRDEPFVSEENLELVSGLIPQPGKGVTLVFFTDIHNPPGNALRPMFGEKRFWYHIECIDDSDNESDVSAGIVGHLKDITPPAPPKNVQAEGFETFIRITWDTVSELDDEGDETIAGYNIYRSLCDLGEWACLQENPSQDPCDAFFEPLGFLSQADALADGAVWDDMTVPEGSPLCYAYLVKTVDEAQNLSGSFPPNLVIETIVCERLRDKTPPEAAVVSGLFARDRGILVEWIGPPVQDIKAYHVYRSEAEDGKYGWVGGVTVEIPPEQPKILKKPYNLELTGCDEIPLQIRDDMSSGSFLDKNVDPKKIYFYKVVGVDQSANEASLDEAVPVSTFTFTRAKAALPTIAVKAQLKPCGLAINWTPDFDADLHRGFALYRSSAVAGPYLQVGGDLFEGNTYLDQRIARGKTYYYRVALVGRDGKTSLSTVTNGKVD